MRVFSLRAKILFFFLSAIFVFGSLSALFGYGIIKSNVLKRAQKQVQFDIQTARVVYNNVLEKVAVSFTSLPKPQAPLLLKQQLGLDYLYVVNTPSAGAPASEIIREALAGRPCGGSRIIDSCELARLGGSLAMQARIDVVPTPLSNLSPRSTLTNALAIEYARPFFNAQGMVTSVLVGGKILNRYFAIVDTIRNTMYGNSTYRGKPIGTVTIFLNDVRISTNVVTNDGNRAIGTHVSSQVYHNIFIAKKPWLDRAFVVTDWYLTAYEPIEDIHKKTIGMLYVGTLEKPFTDMIFHTLWQYCLIVGLVAILGSIAAFLFANSLSKPLRQFAANAGTIASGDMSHRFDMTVSVLEIKQLSESFNEMADMLLQRELALTTNNNELEKLNERYLNLVGMVSHELKGILASAMLNACSVRDGFLGECTPVQKKSLDSVIRNLEYFDATVMNFLNLSRIEKGELTLSIRNILIREDIIDKSIDSFLSQADAKKMVVHNHVSRDCIVQADQALLLIVVNNLLGNAVKYGMPSSEIVISSKQTQDTTTISVYSAGRPLTNQESTKLFKRFSRIETAAETKKTRGTGIGLFLCKTIIENHGGTVIHTSDENGNFFLFSLKNIHG